MSVGRHLSLELGEPVELDGNLPRHVVRIRSRVPDHQETSVVGDQVAITVLPPDLTRRLTAQASASHGAGAR